MEIGIYRVRVDSSERCFARSRRPPEYERKNVPLLDSQPKRLSFADKMLLSDEPLEGMRPDLASKRFHK
jgi:hypothetical protein